MTWRAGCAAWITATSRNIHITAGPSAMNLQPNPGHHQWTTDVASDSKVEYGPTAAFTGSRPTKAAMVTSSLRWC